MTLCRVMATSRKTTSVQAMGTDSNIAAGSYDSGYGFTGAIGTDGGKFRGSKIGTLTFRAD